MSRDVDDAPSTATGLPVGWNETATDYERDATLADVVAARVAERPDAIAIEDRNRALTYADLDEWASEVARRLAPHIDAVDQCVGVVAHRSVEAVVALLAIVKAGAAYVPLDAALPAERLRFMIADSSARAVLVTSALRERTAGLADRPVVLIDQRDGVASTDPTLSGIRPAVGPQSLLYVMYTSGSTGRPKGVAIEHRGVLRFVRGAHSVIPRPGDAVLHVARIGFDASAFEIWGALCNGARLVVDDALRFDPHEVGRTIEDHGVTVAMFSTGAFHLMVDGSLESLRGVRTVFAIGDVLSPGHAARALATHPATTLINTYGPTETTIAASLYRVGDLEPGRSVPIGRPLANTQLYILDDRRMPVKSGEKGELFVGGDGVARGYLGLPDVTAERFVPNPLSNDPRDRIYATGDVVRLLPSGDLEFHGRLDHQVKIQGYRVEPAEIAAVLSGHPDVLAAEVLVSEGPNDGKRLIAFVTTRYDMDPGRLRRYLGRRLPEHMVPSEIVPVEHVPQTDIGKLDREALAGLTSRRPGRPPATANEELVARRWGQVLGVGEVSAVDDFFDLGGDSLLALHVLATLAGDTGVELPLRVVFEDRTVEALARRLELGPSPGASGDEGWPALVAGWAGPQAPASVVQAQACFVAELAEDALPYQSNAALNFRGSLDVVALERALQSVVDRHEILRSTFPKVRGVRMMRVHPDYSVRLEVVDLRQAPDPQAAMEVVRAQRLAQRLEPQELPLVKWTLVRLADDFSTLLQVEHHVVHDGWSFVSLIGEILATYQDFAAGAEHDAAPEPIQYGDFAAWQNALSDTEVGRRQLEFWRGALAGIPEAPVLPGDRMTPNERTYRGTSLRRELSAELVDRIHRRAARVGATPFMVTLAAYVVLLSRLGDVDEVVVGSGLANRRLAGTADLLGMFVNSVVLRVDLSGDPGVDELLSRVRAACLAAYANQELPFEEVVRQLAPPRRVGHNPYFDHFFSFHDTPGEFVNVEGLEVEVVDVLSNGSAKADLNVIVVNQRGRGATSDRPDGRELTVIWEYSSDILDESTSERWLTAYLYVLDQLVSSGNPRISELELATPAQRRELVRVQPASYERDASVYQVFTDRVRERPDSMALSAGATRLTYDDLDRAATRLARQLASLGVGRGVRVGVTDDRTPATVVTLLAVLRAGGCYVGLDRTWPESRLERILTDAQVRVVCDTGTEARPVPRQVATVLDVGADGHGRVRREPLTRPVAPTSHARASDVAYVSFTSGSTGEPKGVEALHRGVVRLVRGSDYATILPSDSVLHAAPLAFDASTFEIWGALLNGARLVLAPSGPLAMAELAHALTDQSVTTAFFTTAIFHRLVDHELGALASLRLVLAGGDVLSPAHVNRLLDALDSTAAFIACYGPTEGTTFSCCHVLRHGDHVGSTVPIGRAIAHSSAVVVDRAGRLAPDGVAGDLWIGGDGVARGYVGRPDLTAERFYENPFGGGLGDRIYRTGDRVRRRTDGALEFLGRVDRQVKIRGFRVEPSETEAALLAHPRVGEAFVVPWVFGRDDRRLVAYVAAARAEGPRPSDGELAEFVADRLPSYMVPARFVWVGELPLRPSGKVDVSRLPEPTSTWFTADPSHPETDLADLVVRHEVGSSSLEKTLVALWQEVLGVRDVGLDDDFFDLGGHSLLAVELFAAIERTTGARLRLATIFEAPTVSALARVLHSDGWDVAIGSLVALTRSGSRPPLFAVTAGDGNAAGFGPLARRLGPNQPFYVLQPFGLDSAAPLHRSVEAMARHYVRAIRRVQPHGPYLLGGRCFGSLVAYEVAHRLESAGETVALLASIDSGGPLWRTRRLANGVVYDPAMNEARVQALDEGFDVGPVFRDRAAADDFVAWLLEPVGEAGDVSRYVHAAFLARPDLQRAYTRGDGEVDVEGLMGWAWMSGRREMGIQASLLGTRPEGVGRSTGHRPVRSSMRRARDRTLDWVNFVTAGRITRLARRRGDDVLSVAGQNADRYRAGRLRAPVVLLHASGEHFAHQRMEFAKWYGLEVDRIDHRVVEATHHGMLREPAVADLARTLERCIDEALAVTGWPTHP
ncbi:MAG: amino acid adenylation domain-containing protein [Acidimicrobiales bacterium]